MAIVVKKKSIEEEIVDEKGNVLGRISYYPDDIKAYRILSDIVDSIQKISKDAKNLDKLGSLSEEKIESLEDFEQYAETFNECRGNFHNIDDAIEGIKNNIDEIFGRGTSYLLMGNGHDIELLTPLLDEVMPKFKEQREDKVNQYLDTDSAVM